MIVNLTKYNKNYKVYNRYKTLVLDNDLNKNVDDDRYFLKDADEDLNKNSLMTGKNFRRTWAYYVNIWFKNEKQ